MSVQWQLLCLLADGQLHSGNELATSLGVTRSAIWKNIRQLSSLDIEVVAQAGKGYRLAAPLEMLDKFQINNSLNDRTRQLCEPPEILWISESTSDHLLKKPSPSPGVAHVCLAEYQSSGRGRRGRQWFAPAGHGICLSVARKFSMSPANLSCLGLAVGVGVLRALRSAGAAGAQLKWPNDIVANGCKLAGILIDVQGEAGGPLYVVAGVGVNYHLNHLAEKAVVASGGIAPACMTDVAGVEVAGRNQTAALLINEICAVLADFSKDGFTSLADEWGAADYLAGQRINVQLDDAVLSGVARGITEDGRLRLEANGKLHLLVTGDVSVRAEP
ncbi:MAG: biotin--[acetyl-CoA-carboxylase] ligase [Gammaproteobacteria bacterium]|nr:biotin--[acetyl-CoA-carboxylase] ligase [Gammaproteobacteria bacterium]MCP4089108.1 biotin--[acetyl-CoA-carboxylase] ligase [Gammaproteobacteria bacterium]MCP4276867.1 biotin--[acetyl-CoA-carboxylase] ligase [Gammaproteobacteria bacterium]MCP4830710.1 biotin--[acetyl-CoA-carboxylase] ligase [Gammaproteobacteria bacterium]MCP4928866.1 biotin--[acetyl-CoA-carboxylase] ligase [Gammaproteobacteria bacterium]